MNANTHRKMIDRAARLAAQIERLESQGRAGTRDYGKLSAELSRTTYRLATDSAERHAYTVRSMAAAAHSVARRPIMDAIAAGVEFDWDSFDGMANIVHPQH